mgnify:CR=1 FL=1
MIFVSLFIFWSVIIWWIIRAIIDPEPKNNKFESEDNYFDIYPEKTDEERKELYKSGPWDL